MSERRCNWCGKTYEAKTARSQYCSDRCRKLAKKSRDLAELTPVPIGSRHRVARHITESDIAGAVVQARGAQATFSAGAVGASPADRPLCSRLADGIGRVLDGEGL